MQNINNPTFLLTLRMLKKYDLYTCEVKSCISKNLKMWNNNFEKFYENNELTNIPYNLLYGLKIRYIVDMIWLNKYINSIKNTSQSIILEYSNGDLNRIKEAFRNTNFLDKIPNLTEMIKIINNDDIETIKKIAKHLTE